MKLKEKQELCELTNSVHKMLMDDIQQFLMEYMYEADTNPMAMANALDMPVSQFNRILSGKGTISLGDAIKILVLTDHTITIDELKNCLNEQNAATNMAVDDDECASSVNQTEIPIYYLDDEDNVDDINSVYTEPCFDINDSIDCNARQCNLANDDEKDDEPIITSETPNFDAMSRAELLHIIYSKLWASEISPNATTQELVEFLKDKDRQIKAMKYTESLEKDPKVMDFIGRLKQIAREDPMFKTWIQNHI